MAIVLRPHGKLDLKEAVKLKQKMHEAARITELRNHLFWVVDLAKVTDIDHFGAIALLDIRQYAKRAGHQLFLSNVSTAVRSVLNIAHLTQEFNFLSNNECLPDVSLKSADSEVVKPTQNSQKLAQFPLPASLHSRHLYKTIAELKSKFLEPSADLPVSV
ncbi:MAG: STAS domain-containing protein [Geitlerinemataceae cyanobacterium]